MEAIVFDWDGTLIDSLPRIFEVNLQVLGEYGVPFDEDQIEAIRQTELANELRKRRAEARSGVWMAGKRISISP